MTLDELKYQKSHEWSAQEGDIVTVGITQYAVDQLTDVTHLQLPKVGTAVTAGVPFGEIESVKAVFDLYAPVSGTILEVNAPLASEPSPINTDCYGKGWMIRIQLAPGAGLAHLMTKSQYETQLAEEGH
jgi:glycine cleavage system H protein